MPSMLMRYVSQLFLCAGVDGRRTRILRIFSKIRFEMEPVSIKVAQSSIAKLSLELCCYLLLRRLDVPAFCPEKVFQLPFKTNLCYHTINYTRYAVSEN